MVNGERMLLPIGSALVDGVFHWQVGVGFLGDFDLVFERPDGNSVKMRVTVGPRN